MKRAWVIAGVVLAVSGAASAVPSGSPQEAELRKAFREIEAVKKTARKLSKEAREKVEKAIEGKLSEADAAAVIYEARAKVPEANPTDLSRILYMTTTAAGPKGEIRIGVAVAPDERVVAAALVLDNKDDPAAASPAFLDQFTRFIYAEALAAPASNLKKLRTQASARKTPEDKTLDGLFRMMEVMHPVGRSAADLEAGLGAMAAKPEDAEAVAGAFGDAKKILADLSFLSASQSATFGKRLDEGAKQYRTVADLIKAKKWVEARNAANEAEKESCSRCHAGTQRNFRNQRNSAGIGNGYFAVEHDVFAPPGPRDAYAAIAAAVRRAALVLTEAR